MQPTVPTEFMVLLAGLWNTTATDRSAWRFMAWTQRGRSARRTSRVTGGFQVNPEVWTTNQEKVLNQPKSSLFGSYGPSHASPSGVNRSRILDSLAYRSGLPRPDLFSGCRSDASSRAMRTARRRERVQLSHHDLGVVPDLRCHFDFVHLQLFRIFSSGDRRSRRRPRCENLKWQQ